MTCKVFRIRDSLSEVYYQSLAFIRTFL